MRKLYYNKVMKIICARHTETEGNVRGYYNGVSESSYTQKGLKKKAALENELTRLGKGESVARVYASPILRAARIGETVADRLSVPFETACALREFHFGIFEGMTYREAEAKYPREWQAWMADYDGYAIPGGDSFHDYHRRVADFIEEIKTIHADDTIVIVAHGGTVLSVLVTLLGLPVEARWHFKIELGSIAIVDCPEGYGILNTLYVPAYPDNTAAD